MAYKIRIIGVPMDLGASRRGVDMGPSALRIAGLQSQIKQLGHQVEDTGNVAVKQPEELHFGDKHAKYLNEIAETCHGLKEIVEQTVAEARVLPEALSASWARLRAAWTAAPVPPGAPPAGRSGL